MEIREWAIAHGYKVGTRGRFSREVLAAYAADTGKPTTVAPKINNSAAPVRSWANAHGFNLGARGRIPQEVLTAYNAAHGLEAPPPPKKIKKRRTKAEVAEDTRRAVSTLPKGSVYVCGFCNAGRHDNCPKVVRSGKNIEHNVLCRCGETDHVELASAWVA